MSCTLQKEKVFEKENIVSNVDDEIDVNIAFVGSSIQKNRCYQEILRDYNLFLTINNSKNCKRWIHLDTVLLIYDDKNYVDIYENNFEQVFTSSNAKIQTDKTLTDIVFDENNQYCIFSFKNLLLQDVSKIELILRYTIESESQSEKVEKRLLFYTRTKYTILFKNV